MGGSAWCRVEGVSVSVKALTKLVVKAQKGDKEATRQLIEESQDSLLRFCLYLTSRKELAEDLCQESLVKALSGISKLKDPAGYQSWLFQTAKNLYFDYLKSAHNRKRDGDFDVNEVAFRGEGSDVASAVQKALSQLEPEDRTLLILIDMEGYSYAEAAKMLSLPEANIPSRLHRIRAKFMEIYKP